MIASQCAFAAVKADGTVVAWGNPHHGGMIPEELRDARLKPGCDGDAPISPKISQCLDHFGVENG